jgi:hypothetical protein
VFFDVAPHFGLVQPTIAQGTGELCIQSRSLKVELPYFLYAGVDFVGLKVGLFSLCIMGVV